MDEDENILEVIIERPSWGESSTEYVEEVSPGVYRMYYNSAIFLYLTKGVEFEARKLENGNLEVIRFTKRSPYFTRSFFLPQGYRESELRMIGDELVKLGGHWEVIFGGICIVNVPKEKLEIARQMLRELDRKLEDYLSDL